jgi:hypothetical protein
MQFLLCTWRAFAWPTPTQGRARLGPASSRRLAQRRSRPMTWPALARARRSARTAPRIAPACRPALRGSASDAESITSPRVRDACPGIAGPRAVAGRAGPPRRTFRCGWKYRSLGRNGNTAPRTLLDPRGIAARSERRGRELPSFKRGPRASQDLHRRRAHCARHLVSRLGASESCWLAPGAALDLTDSCAIAIDTERHTHRENSQDGACFGSGCPPRGAE